MRRGQPTSSEHPGTGSPCSDPSRGFQPARLSRTQQPLPHGRGTECRAFTLTEIIVVVSIISLLLAAVLPSLSATWNERKAAETEAKVRGSLAAARMRALNRNEQGLLFVLDDEGHQLIYRIEAEPYDAVNDGATADETSAANRFIVLPGKPVSLPAPYRVAPRSVVDESPPGSGTPLWLPTELTQEDYQATPTSVRIHRNFFTIIFTPQGQLRVGRDVIIHDADSLPNPPVNGDDMGDKTGLEVTNGASTAVTSNWNDGGVSNPLSAGGGLTDVLINSNGDAINFQSVDGLLVYDDETFSELVTVIEQRNFILRTAQPLYISRLSGAVIVGPQGENK